MEAVAKLNNVPTSPRKMRLVANLIRGQRVNKALSILKFESKYGAAKLEKLLLSAIANWQAKNEDARLEDADLFVKEIFVDSGRILKRLDLHLRVGRTEFARDRTMLPLLWIAILQ